ncbi:MAG: hypothetical protein EPN93_11325 [Spirochaetes bacterium]|nr:MAG: hypothetical protein EPN93_11325 [Spirochaetota bacterium]
MVFDSYLIFKLLALVVFGAILGFLSAVPIGAVQLEVAKKALNGHLKPAIAVAFGSATSDLIYGILTLFGFGQFLFHQDFQIFIYILGIGVLLFIIYRTWEEYKHHVHHRHTYPLVYKKRISFFTGFTIAITNPGIIIWWIIGFRMFLDFKLFQDVGPVIKTIFILSACGGLGGYLIFLAILLSKVKKFIPDHLFARMHIALIILLVIVIGFFIFKLYGNIFHFNGDMVSFL